MTRVAAPAAAEKELPPSPLLPLPSCRWVIWPLQGRGWLLWLWLPPASEGAESSWGARGGKGRRGRFPSRGSLFIEGTQSVTAPQLLTVVVTCFWQGSWQAERARGLGIRTLESSPRQPGLQSSWPGGSDGRPSSQGEGPVLLASLGGLVQLLMQNHIVAPL